MKSSASPLSSQRSHWNASSWMLLFGYTVKLSSWSSHSGQLPRHQPVPNDSCSSSVSAPAIWCSGTRPFADALGSFVVYPSVTGTSIPGHAPSPWLWSGLCFTQRSCMVLPGDHAPEVLARLFDALHGLALYLLAEPGLAQLLDQGVETLVD